MIASVILLQALSCGTQSTRTVKPGDRAAMERPASQRVANWQGVYAGTLPCADCEGIATMIQLNADSSYIRETTHLGKSPEADTEKGTFTWSYDRNQLLFEASDTKHVPTYYQVGEGTLTQLDMHGNLIRGDLADRYVLLRDSTGITEKYWRLKEVLGEHIDLAAVRGKEAHIRLKAATTRITGNAGCNSFSGGFSLSPGNRIGFSGIAATKMACTDMETESLLFRVLKMTDSYTLAGDSLQLFQEQMIPLATFVFERQR
jgi:copper homeostasis protein (lipoprotein)